MSESNAVDIEREIVELERRLELAKNRVLRLEHSYVVDLISVLKGHPNGRPRRRVIEILESERAKLGISIPATFTETVQASYQRHSADSEIFKKKKSVGEEPLFYSPQGKGSGKWAVHLAASSAWLDRTIIDLI